MDGGHDAATWVSVSFVYISFDFHRDSSQFDDYFLKDASGFS